MRGNRRGRDDQVGLSELFGNVPAEVKLHRQPVELLDGFGQLLRRLTVSDEYLCALRDEPPRHPDPAAKPAKARDGDTLVPDITHAHIDDIGRPHSGHRSLLARRS